MKLTLTDGRYILRSTFEERHAAKAAGLRWDPVGRTWWTDSAEKAARLVAHADETCREALAGIAARQDEALAASRAISADIAIPCPEGLDYLPFQRAGIAFALSRAGVLFGDDMGLGKTIQAIGIYNADPTLSSVLILCPASLRLNWQREWTRWSTRPASIEIATTAGVPTADVVICNYDIAERLAPALRARAWDYLICDEAHLLKNPEAKRTQAVLGRPARKTAGQEAIPGLTARRRAFLTGTPIPNRPIEAQTILGALCPDRFGNRFGYGRRWCDGHQKPAGRKMVWDFSGASNLAELQRAARESVMVRRLKGQVLTELPPKRRAVIEIPANGAAPAVERERRAWLQHEESVTEAQVRVELSRASDDRADYERAVDGLAAAQRAAFTEMSIRRHETALAKVPAVIERLGLVLDEEGRKAVVFAHHHDVVEAIRVAFADTAVVLTGETPMLARQQAVDRFQTDPACRLFIGSITAAGVGLTLTAAAHVVFAELDWVPGNVTQAEDRCYRIGQHDSVLVEHLVLEGSLDARMARVLVEKQDVADRALDRLADETASEPVTLERAATSGARRAKLDEEATQLSPDMIAQVHEALRMLAARCDGAVTLDGAGFSRVDVRVGKSLAEAGALTPRQAALGARLARKYRRQLDGWTFTGVAEEAIEDGA